jgi:hypothetical protein
MDNKSTVKAILCSFLSLIAFFVVEAVAAFVLTLITNILYQTGAENIANWFSRFAAQDSFLIPIVALFFVNWLVPAFCKQQDQSKFCKTLVGAYLLLIGIVCLVINLLNGNSIWINISTAASGLILLFDKIDEFTK